MARVREAREVVGEILRETRRISGRARNGIKSLVSGASCTSRRSNSMGTTAIKLVAYFSTVAKFYVCDKSVATTRTMTTLSGFRSVGRFNRVDTGKQRCKVYRYGPV